MGSELIYFISDTHLGDGTGADRFLYPRQLMELLAKIESEPRAQLVLLGDFMELWGASLEGVLIRHRPVVQALASIAATRPVTYVVGNHDCLPWYYYLGSKWGKVRISERFEARRAGLVAVHGHQYDPFNQVGVGADGNVKAPWTRRLVQGLGFLGRVGGPGATHAIDDAADALGKAAASLENLVPDWNQQSRQHALVGLEKTQDLLRRQSPGERGYPLGEAAYEDAARAILRDGAQFVLMGHTHHPLKHQYGTRMYVNTGSWVWDRYPPTYARFRNGELELLEANTHTPFRR